MHRPVRTLTSRLGLTAVAAAVAVLAAACVAPVGTNDAGVYLPDENAKIVEIARGSRGALDGINRTGNNVAAYGWAMAMGPNATSTPAEVEIRFLNAADKVVATTTTAANQLRADVGRVMPLWGDLRGFTALYTLTGTGLTAVKGCAYILGAGPERIPVGVCRDISQPAATTTTTAAPTTTTPTSTTSTSTTSTSTTTTTTTTTIPVPGGLEITSVSPNAGSALGYEEVTITGSGFTDATDVRFGGDMAPTFTVDSDTQITALTPPGFFGVVDVTVTVDGLTSAVNDNAKYTYLP